MPEDKVQQWEYKEKSCVNCFYLLVDNSPDQTGPSIWCGRGHFDGIGSKEDEGELYKPNTCIDFKPQSLNPSPQ
jgi:hypothetical protein